MTQLDFSNTASNKRSLNRPSSAVSVYIGPTFLIFTLVLIVCLISVVTLMFSTKGITKGYTLKKLEAEHEQLLRDNEVKTMHVAEVRSLASIKASPRAQSMVRPGKVVYYRYDTAIASK